MMSTCYCTKNNVCVAKHHAVRENVCVCQLVCVCVQGKGERESERGRKRERGNVKRAERKKKRQKRKRDLAQRAEGKVSAPAEENVL